MKRRHFFLYIFLLALVILSCSGRGPGQPVKQGTIDLRNWDFEKNGSVKLDGQWEFYGNRFLTEKDFQIETLPPVSYCKVPGRWCARDESSDSAATGFATYRVVILKPVSLNRIAIRIPNISSAYALELNGEELVNGRAAKTASAERPSGASRTIAVSTESTQASFLIHVSNFHDLTGAVWRSLEIGPEAQIRQRNRELLALDFLIIGSLLIMFLYHFVIFVLRPGVLSAFYFSFFCLAMGLRTGLKGERFFYSLVSDQYWFLAHKLEYLTFYLALMFFAGYIHNLYPAEMKKGVLRLIQVAAGLFSLSVLVLPAPHYQQFLVFYQTITAGLIVYAAFVSVLALQRGRELIRVFILGCGAMLSGAAIDLLHNNHLYILNFDNVSAFGILFFVISQAFLLSARFSRAFETVEKLTQDLESRVERRTQELRHSRDEVETLNEFSRKLNETDNLDEIIDSIFHYLATRYGLRAMLQLVDPEKNILYTVKGTLTGVSEETNDALMNLKVPLTRAGGLAYLVYRRKKAFYSEQIEKFPSKIDRFIADAMDLKSVFITPLLIQNQVIGLMSLSGLSKPMKLSEADIRSISGFCEQIAGAVHSSSLLLKARDATETIASAKAEIEELNGLLNEINQINDVEQIGRILADFVSSQYRIPYSNIFVFNEPGTHVQFLSGPVPDWLTAEQQDFLRNRAFPVVGVASGAFMLVNQRRQPTFFARMRRSTATPEEQFIIDAYKIKSLLIIPLIIQNEIIGFLNFSASDDTQRLSKHLRVKLSILAEQIAGVIYSKNLLAQIQEARNKSDDLLATITRDLEIARRIQQTLIPSVMPEHHAVKVEALYLPMEQVGGDLFDFVEFPNGRFGLFIADVSGHGIPAAMVASMAKLALSIIAGHISSPAEFVEYLNSYLQGKTADHFLTCFYGIYDPVTAELTFVNAGHPPFLLFRDNEISTHAAKGPPVGIIDQVSYKENVISLRPGDRTFFFTDGIEEAANEDQELFGLDRIKSTIRKRAVASLGQHLKGLLEEVLEFQGSAEFQDDVTLLALDIQSDRADLPGR